MANPQDITSDNGLPGFSISGFKSYLNKTGHLPVNRFYVDLVIPPVLMNGRMRVNGKDIQINQVFSKDIAFRAESIRAPGVAINFSNISRYGVGPIQKFPFNAQFTDVSISFLADRDSLIWAFFYNWLNNVFNYAPDDENPREDFTRYRANYMDDFATDIFVHVYHYDGILSNTLQLIDAYPVSMNDVALAWDSNNQNMKITVTFAFRHWRMSEVTAQDNSTRPNSVPPLHIPKRAETVQSVTVRSLPPDPTQNFLNPQGRFNSATVPEGTETPTYSWF